MFKHNKYSKFLGYSSDGKGVNVYAYIYVLLLMSSIFLLLYGCGRESSTTPGSSTLYFGWWDGDAPDSYDPLIIIAAPLGPEIIPAEYPTVSFPADREEYLQAIVDCYDAGASVVHIVPVGLEPDTTEYLFDWDWNNYKFIIDYVVENCPGMLILADITDAGVLTQDSLKADSSVSFVSPIYGRYLFNDQWTGSDNPAENGASILDWQASGVKVIPFILSPFQADYLERYLVNNYLQQPYHFTVAIGWEGNTASTPGVFDNIINTLPDTSIILTACTLENPNELMGMAIADGHHIIVGMKYAVYFPGDTYDPLSSSAYLVRKAVELAGQMNREIATPDQARMILNAYR